MKRTSLITVVVAFALVAMASQDALARNRMYNPAVGRFMQRDPAGTMIVAPPPMARNLSGSMYTQRDPTRQYADGMNLYQYTRSDPVGQTDPFGLWGSDEHTSITKKAFDKAFPSIPPGNLLKCKDYVVAVVVKGNLWQDSDSNAFNQNKRHYNRDLNQTPAAADAAYTAYLAKEVGDFRTLLATVRGKCDSSAHVKTCGDALWTLGRVSHSWEDYFAHAVLLSGKAGPAWGATPQIKGTPDNLNAQLKASSWGGFLNTGEHGGLLDGEPASRDNPGGWKKRYDDAVDFVGAEFKALLPEWYKKCDCCCPPK